MRALAFLSLSAMLMAAGCGASPEAARHSQEYTPSTKAATRSGNVVKFEPDSPQLTRIRVADVESAAVPADELIAPGKIEADPGRVSRVTLPVAGRVRQVLVTLGDRVEQGQALLTLASPEVSVLQAGWRQAEANVAQARVALAKAEADVSRAQDLLANRAIAQKEVLSAETILAQAKASLEQAQAAREETARRLELLGLEPGSMEQLITVRAPIPGKVIEISVAPGEYRSDTAAPVLTVADLSAVWVAADVPESAIRLVRIGEPVSIQLSAFPDRSYNGRVRRIGDVVDPQTRTIKVRAELKNPEGRFRPEMSATIRHSRGTKRAIVVPRAALFQQQDRTTVFRERKRGEFEEVTVTVGWQDEQRAAIDAGLQPNDRVVVDGVTQLRAY
jgi:cobalt-zinc-cadmium efflux system membrane fusion protein